MRIAAAVVSFIASSTTVAFAGAREDVIAADKAFSTLCVEKGSNAAFLTYLAEDGRLFGTGNDAPIIGKEEAIKRFADPKSGNGDPKRSVLSWEPEHA